MGNKLLYAGFETCFGWPRPRHQGAGCKTHLEFRSCANLICDLCFTRAQAVAPETRSTCRRTSGDSRPADSGCRTGCGDTYSMHKNTHTTTTRPAQIKKDAKWCVHTCHQAPLPPPGHDKMYARVSKTLNRHLLALLCVPINTPRAQIGTSATHAGSRGLIRCTCLGRRHGVGRGDTDMALENRCVRVDGVLHHRHVCRSTGHLHVIAPGAKSGADLPAGRQHVFAGLFSDPVGGWVPALLGGQPWLHNSAGSALFILYGGENHVVRRAACGVSRAG